MLRRLALCVLCTMAMALGLALRGGLSGILVILSVMGFLWLVGTTIERHLGPSPRDEGDEPEWPGPDN